MYSTSRKEFVDIFCMLYNKIDSALNDCELTNETRVITNDTAKAKAEIIQNINDNTNDRIESLEKLINSALSRNNAVTADQLPSEEVYLGYNKRIKDIISNHQTSETFQCAIETLNEVIGDIADTTNDLSAENRELLLLFVRDSQAQYYVNSGEFEKAKKAITKAEAYIKKTHTNEYKRHFFISAYILVLCDNKDSYEKALSLLAKAIEIDSHYHIAVFMYHEIKSLLSQTSIDEQISEIEEYFQNYVNSTEDANCFRHITMHWAVYISIIAFMKKPLKIFRLPKRTNKTSLIN